MIRALNVVYKSDTVCQFLDTLLYYRFTLQWIFLAISVHTQGPITKQISDIKKQNISYKYVFRSFIQYF